MAEQLFIISIMHSSSLNILFIANLIEKIKQTYITHSFYLVFIFKQIKLKLKQIKQAIFILFSKFITTIKRKEIN